MDQQTNQGPSASTPKQQVVEAIKSATNVLVTVSRDPNVDQLSACIGLTLMLNKLGKHATAVFSGSVPSTLEFLQPEKTLEQNTDSLRDFIISLDRSKADKLRYKVEDDVVKIFITPYRTSLSGEDLVFSQGDFNVDVVIALGVDQRDHLDDAIIAHGRILHDAKVIGVSHGEQASDVGAINWHEPAASSLSEMLVSISESFQSGLLDAQMSTAFLTGIVAETDRFKNQKTTPKVMTMSAQLMAAGANQQLIATQLALPPKEPEPEPTPEPEEHVPIAEQPVEADSASEVSPEDSKEPEPEPTPEPVSEPGMLDVQDAVDGISSETPTMSLHDDPTPESPEPPEPAPEPENQIHIDEHGKIIDEAEVKSRQKVIEPLTMKPPKGPKTDLSNYVFEDPSQLTFTANTKPEEVQDIVDPLQADIASGNPDTPLLDHTEVSHIENQAPDVNSVVSIPEPLGEKQDEPPAEEADLPPAPTLDDLKLDEDAAREAVLKAVVSDSSGSGHNPIEALNANLCRWTNRYWIQVREPYSLRRPLYLRP